MKKFLMVLLVIGSSATAMACTSELGPSEVETAEQVVEGDLRSDEVTPSEVGDLLGIMPEHAEQLMGKHGVARTYHDQRVWNVSGRQLELMALDLADE